MRYWSAILGKLSMLVNCLEASTLLEAKAEPFFMQFIMQFALPHPSVAKFCFLLTTCRYALDVAEGVPVRRILFQF